jgi:hypothetical protein
MLKSLALIIVVLKSLIFSYEGDLMLVAYSVDPAHRPNFSNYMGFTCPDCCEVLTHCYEGALEFLGVTSHNDAADKQSATVLETIGNPIPCEEQDVPPFIVSQLSMRRRGSNDSINSSPRSPISRKVFE